MTQSERLDYLLDEFKMDSLEYKNLKTSNVAEDKQALLRSLMNIRMPRAMDAEVLKVQEAYLKERAVEKGIVRLCDIQTVREEFNSTHPFSDKLSIWQGDITRLALGAIVNAANSQMLGCFVPMHTCIDNCIHTFAGIELREECCRYMNRRRAEYGSDYEEPTGGAVLTAGYNLPAEHVIHTVGPIVHSRLTDALRSDLASCYRSVLQCCVENGIRSIAFCCISTGVFRFPNEEAANIAVDTVTDFLRRHGDCFDRVIFNVFGDKDKEIYQGLFAR